MSLLSRLAVQAARAYGILSSRNTKVLADFLVVAGGGGGVETGNAYYKGGGGGAGGFRTSAGTSGGGASAEPVITLSTLNTYSIVIGAGGTGSINGNDSSVSGTGLTTITSLGGGGLGSNGGASGGSGGAGNVSSFQANITITGGAGTTGQGYAAGTGYNTANSNITFGSGAGGGGASAVGSDGVARNTTGAGGNGGNGVASSISGSSVTYAGGGGGAGYSTGGTGGTGGGGNGGGGGAGSSGTANTGGGGGGGAGSSGTGGSGGSGVVIISYTSATPKFTGGTITTSGGKQIHTFTSTGTLSPITPITASYLVVAGGASGGSTGGGGAGGLLTSSTTLYSGATYVVTVGAGGALTSTNAKGNNGSDSSILGTGLTTITATGGGGGGAEAIAPNSGGSGGGGGGSVAVRSGGAGTSGQGNAGGNGNDNGLGSAFAGGGGGGAGAVGSNASTASVAGAGGNGSASSISGSSVTYAGGGGGGAYLASSTGSAGAGGTGGGGAGGRNGLNATSGTANTGGGGGGNGFTSAGNYQGNSGAGGSGVVIISYAGSQAFNGGLVTSSGGNTIHTFTSTGALTPLTNNLTNSLRFRSSASAYLNRTPTVGGNLRTWTASFWYKNGSIDSNQTLFSNATASDSIGFRSSRTVEIYFGAGSANLVTTQVFRDVAAWYHIVVAVDTTQATAANRIKLYVNGNQVTAFSTATYPSQNYDTSFNKVSTAQEIGRRSSNSDLFLDGYMADINWIDGQALEPYYFGNNDANGVWKPILYKGTYGTNGFYLPFTQNTSTTAYAGQFSGSNNLEVAQNAAFNLAGTSWTIEGWYLWDGNTSDFRTFFAKRTGVTGSYQLYLQSGSAEIRFYNGSTIINNVGTMPINNWTHIACVYNGSTLTVYMNGISIYSGAITITDITSPFYVGYSGSGGGEMWTGYISNFRLVKGTAVYTQKFVPPTSALTNISGTSLLTCQNSTAIDNSSNAFSITNNGSVTFPSGNIIFNANIATDASGNINNWQPNNINYSTYGTTYDAMTDVPTNTSATVANYAVLNPIGNNIAYTVSNGNLTINNGSAPKGTKPASFFVTSGKWYWEVLGNGYAGAVCGTTGASSTLSISSTGSNGIGYWEGGLVYWDGGNSGAGPASYTSSDVIGIALNMDAGTVAFYKNNSLQYTATFGSGTVPNLSSGCFPCYNDGASATSKIANFTFGQRPFSYTPPTGFVALNTFNLPTPTILQGNKYMDATLYTGTGALQNIVNAGTFQPDLIWLKQRSVSGNHGLYDSIRGISYRLISNLTNAEASVPLDSFNTNGFTTTSNYNNSGETIVAWQWQAGQGSTSSNTSGSISSTVSVNTTAGFSVVTYTGNSTAGATIGHGLGVTPAMIITKTVSTALGNWGVYHASLGATKGLNLNNTIAAATLTQFWNNTAPTSSVFTVGTSNDVNGASTYVAYCWAAIAGFSAFGSYTGNGSADGPFVYTGFRPKYIVLKSTTTAGSNWWAEDTSRSTYNAANALLFPNLSNAEYTTAGVETDILSNGFKLRTSSNDGNKSGDTFIYMAFAENPFKNANAR